MYTTGFGGTLWKPGSEAYVCNSYYEEFQGPSRAKPNQPQRLDVILLSKSQMEMYTGLYPKAFQLLLHWLQPILPCRSKLDTSLHALEEDDETISSTPYALWQLLF